VNRYVMDVSFGSQNCNSLNVSTSVRNQAAKIVSISDMDSDIIFLSDTRLNGRHKSIVDAFRMKYIMYYHSSLNRRGVAILVKNNLDFQVLEEIRDLQENALLLRVLIKNVECVIGSVYGPNTNELSFYDFLQEKLQRWPALPVILGGDWNATYSNLPNDINPDVFSMRAIPSTVRSDRILQLCEEFGLSDPYRSLHPDARDYTYVPSGVLRINRSRIDFFLVSDSIFGNVTTCTIAQSFCKNAFDHKNIMLSFKKQKRKGRLCINDRILTNPLLECAIKLAIYECYISEFRLEPGGLIAMLVQEECLRLNEIDSMFTEAIYLQGKSVVLGLTVEETAREEDLAASMGRAWTEVMSYDFLQQQERKCTDDVFFEKLIEYVRKAALKIQSLVKKAEELDRNALLKKLAELKTAGSFDNNFVQIQEIENRLNLLDEKINADKVVNYLKSDVLNNEKITPHFLRLAKTLSSDSLEKIRNTNGEPFEKKKDREKHIVDFYRKLYSLPNDMPADFTNCIEEFLGPDICRNPVVENSKLDQNEKENLDQPLRIGELDEAVKNLNLRSAPGIDGVSNRFIVKFWKYFREPLFRYATTCINNGKLTDTFRTAIIRLIPKKGDTTQLKNWRLISLLSCYYKIVSKALNARLGTVIGKVTSMAQKAYSPDRYMHEAIINTVETIKHCQTRNVEGVLLSVDLHKAFDSVLHEFMREVYRFFGFGEYFIRMSEALGNGRAAKIILDDGNYSESIELHRCRPQGDSPSPRQFNMCQQICIFKIELDPEIKSVYLTFVVPRTMGRGETESNHLATEEEVRLAPGH